MLRTLLIGSAAAVALASITPAQALTMQECSVKYQDAKKANKLKGQKWNDFRKAECGDDDASDNDASSLVKEDPAPPRPAAAAAKAAPAAAQKAGVPAAATTAAAPAAAAVAAPKPTGRMVYPRSVDAKFANETAGKARLHTCAQQYNANKAGNANGGLRWIEAGGGYWSMCNKRLKGV